MFCYHCGSNIYDGYICPVCGADNRQTTTAGSGYNSGYGNSYTQPEGINSGNRYTQPQGQSYNQSPHDQSYNQSYKQLYKQPHNQEYNQGYGPTYGQMNTLPSGTQNNKGSSAWLYLIPAVLIVCLASIIFVKKYLDEHPKMIHETISVSQQKKTTEAEAPQYSDAEKEQLKQQDIETAARIAEAIESAYKRDKEAGEPKFSENYFSYGWGFPIDERVILSDYGMAHNSDGFAYRVADYFYQNLGGYYPEPVYQFDTNKHYFYVKQTASNEFVVGVCNLGTSSRYQLYPEVSEKYLKK